MLGQLSRRWRQLGRSCDRLRVDKAVFHALLAIRFRFCRLAGPCFGVIALAATLHSGTEQATAVKLTLGLAHDLQQLADLFLAHRFAVVVTLGELATNRAQEGDILGSLHAFGNDLLVEFLSKRHD
jgi:hypothetical protein